MERTLFAHAEAGLFGPALDAAIAPNETSAAPTTVVTGKGLPSSASRAGLPSDAQGPQADHGGQHTDSGDGQHEQPGELGQVGGERQDR